MMKEKEEVTEKRVKQKHNNKPSRPLKKNSLDVTSISRVREPGEGKDRKREEDLKRARRRRRKTQQEKKSRKKLLIQRHRNAVAKRNYEKSSLPRCFSPGITGVIMQERSKIYLN